MKKETSRLRLAALASTASAEHARAFRRGAALSHASWLVASLACACGAPRQAEAVDPGPPVVLALAGCRYGDGPGCTTTCSKGYTEDCASLAVMLLHGDGIAIDLVRSRKLAGSSCAAGSMRGCNALGLLLERGEGGAKDERRALELYTLACDANEWRGCANLGEAQSFGRDGLTADESKAAEHFERACRLGSPKSCLLAATRLEPGGGAENGPRAAELFRLACDGGNMDGCSGLGACYARGFGVSRDEQRATALFRRACDGGAGIGCKGLGDMMATGDLGAAARLYQRSCDLGYAGGCAYLGDAMTEGRGVPADRARGAALMRDACAQHYPWACERLKIIP